MGFNNIPECPYDGCTYDVNNFDSALNDFRKGSCEDYAIYYGSGSEDMLVFRIWDTGLIDIYASDNVKELSTPVSEFNAKNIFQFCNRAYNEEIFPDKDGDGTIDLDDVDISSQFTDSIVLAVFDAVNMRSLHIPFGNNPISDFHGEQHLSEVYSQGSNNSNLYIDASSAYSGLQPIRTIPRVFLGGTCGTSTWRNELIPIIESYGVDYFNPVVENWTEECYQRELDERAKDMVLVYALTNEMEGVYSIAEIIDDCHECPNNLIFCNLWQDDPNQPFMTKSLSKVQKMVESHGVQSCTSIQELADAIYYKLQDLNQR
jgi:hypothetical protein